MEIVKFNINDYLKGRAYKIKKDYEENTKRFIVKSMNRLAKLLIQDMQEYKVYMTTREMNVISSDNFNMYSYDIVDLLGELGVMNSYDEYGFEFVDTDKPNLKMLIIKFDRNIAEYTFSYDKPITLLD